MSDAGDLTLLRRYEPVLRFARGERFFPMGVAPYVRSAGLWLRHPGEEPVCLAEPGAVSLLTLGQPRRDPFGTVCYLKLTEPAGLTGTAADAVRELRASDSFRPGRGRLARVGFGSRLIDALFNLSLLARGRVPGDTAAAAKRVYAGYAEEARAPRYHGRVLRRDGWIVLQYWYFYLFNNWRSGFRGANDHEADWEMVCVYLEDPPDGPPAPVWVAYASHDYSGDDLRRRWDDPALDKVGTHPVVYVGAGSHAAYFRPGEYLTEIELPLLRPLVRLTQAAQRVWYDRLRQYRGATVRRSADGGTLFHIPFVDYARGDGETIGAGGDRPWATPRLLDDSIAWVRHFRGLWGWYAQDPFAGEDAPAGPMYNRDGSVRQAWADPLGWAGVDKLTPPHAADAATASQLQTLAQTQTRLAAEADETVRALRAAQTRLAALEAQPHLAAAHTAQAVHVESLTRRSADQQRALTENAALLDALRHHQAALERGDRPAPRAHIRRAHLPASAEELRVSRLAEFWAAISVGLALVSVVALYILAPDRFVIGVGAMVTLLTFIEAGFRRRLAQLVTAVTIVLALTAAGVLLVEFFDEIALVALLTAGGYILLENVRELWR